MTSTYVQELLTGNAAYRLGIRTDESGDMVIEVHGATPEGVVVSDGQLRFPGPDGAEVGRAMAKAITVQSRLMGRKPKAPNANTPWTKEMDEHLRAEWMTLDATEDAANTIRKLAASMERSATAIRARLTRLGCDPDVPGRELSAAALAVMGIPQIASLSDK